MTRRGFKTFLIGLVALASTFAAAAATIPSPVHPHADPLKAAAATVAGQEGLAFDAAALTKLQKATTRVVEIGGFPLGPGEVGTLRLTRLQVAAPAGRISIQTSNGERSMPLPSVTHFSGSIIGEPDSSVYLGVVADGVVAYMHSSRGHVYVGPDETKSGFVVRTADSPLNAAASLTPWSCGAEAMPASLTAAAEPSYPAAELPNVAGVKQAAVRIETDHQLYTRFGGDANAIATYVMTLFGAIDVVYYRDLSLYLIVTEVHVWSVADPYTGADTFTQLQQLGDWWHANKPIASNPRAFVHYLSGHDVTGGIAWLSVLCNGDFSQGGHYGGGYGLTQVYGTYPLQFWDQFASAHEMGHNAGSPHTHCYSPPIDECYSGESGCYVGPTSVPPEKGTIMSYCHLLGGYDAIVMKFHDRCINEKMMPEINGAACLTVPGTFVDVLPSDPFFSYIETVYGSGVTGGCNTDPLMYCPWKTVTRQQMAVFILKGLHGSAYAPPACAGIFTDVPCSSSYAPWIEELSVEGITGGCGNGTTYCPNDPVTRQQMAAFLLKAEHGSDYVPPACSSNPFTDVACPSPFANWIQQLVAEAITGGCGGGNYCPTSGVTRGQMAVFLVKTFGLP